MRLLRPFCFVFLLTTAQAQIALDDIFPPVDFGPIRARTTALKAKVPPRPDNPQLVPAWANLNTALRKARFMLDRYNPTAYLLPYIETELQTAAMAMKSLSNGVPYQPPAGLLGEGYHSSIDDSFQPFLRYVPPQAAGGKKLPMIVYLHGYTPYLDLINWSSFPSSLVAYAEKAGFYLVAPFARSNTDFQGIGEHDVMRVIREMEERYNIDSDRIILSGISMGGMGVWTIAGHHPERFAGLLVVSGRGDYYFWQGVKRQDIAPYKQQLIDTEFGYSMIGRIAHIPTFCIHGAADPLIPVAESRHMVEAVRKLNTELTYVELPQGDHWIYEEAYARDDIHKWLPLQRRKALPVSIPPIPPLGRPVKTAFLSPFIFVSAAKETDPRNAERFQAAVSDWYEFSKSYPRAAMEETIQPEVLATHNVFLFGEPEDSPLIRQALQDSPIQIEKTHFVMGDKRFPRSGNGLYLVRPSPWNKQKMVVIQCGLAWGKGLPSNHKYDFLPEYIIYSNQRDSDGSNTALSAGFFDKNWKLPQKP